MPRRRALSPTARVLILLVFGTAIGWAVGTPPIDSGPDPTARQVFGAVIGAAIALLFEAWTRWEEPR